MIPLRVSLFSLAVLAATAAPVLAQRVEIQLQPKVVRPGEAPLLTAAAINDLKLSDEQRDKYAKIESDFKDKVKAAQEKQRTDLAGVNERAKVREAVEAFQAATAKAREDRLAKVESLLNADQKKQFAQIKLQPVQPGGGVRPLPIQIGGAGINPLVPVPVQNRLQLTDEQKKQLEAIQKEAEAKIMKLLTDEQKKTLEQMKKGPLIRPNPIQPVPPIQIRPPVRNIDPALPNPAKD